MNTKLTYDMEFIPGGFIREIKFNLKTSHGYELLILRNMPNADDVTVIKETLCKADNMAKTIIITAMLCMAGMLWLLLQHIISHIPETQTINTLEILTAIAIVISGILLWKNAEFLAMGYALYKSKYNATLRRFLKGMDFKTAADREKAQAKLYTIKANAEAIWNFIHMICEKQVIKSTFEADCSGITNAWIKYSYADKEGDIYESCIPMTLDVTENITLLEGVNVIDFTDMTFRMGRKAKNDSSVEIGN